jgi:two-component system, LuxR family, sensor kinase FixL
MEIGLIENISDVFLTEILGTIETPIVILDCGGEILQFNPACEHLTGFRSSEVVGEKVWDCLIPDDEINSVRRIFEETRARELPTHFTNHWRSKDGSFPLLRWTNKAIKNEAGDIKAIIATAIDLTPLKTVEHKLTETQSFLKSIVNASPEAIVTINEKGEIISFSRQAEVMFGYKEDQVAGQNLTILMTDADHSRYDEYIRHHIETGEIMTTGNARYIVALRKNGDEFPASLHITEFTDGQRVFVGFIEDISEQRATERRLSETQTLLEHAGRVGAMGEIATSIAHELNQPLTAAASLAGAVALTLEKEDFRKPDEVLSMLHDAISEIRRASEIIQQMREFIQKRKTARSLHNINKIISEAGALALIGAGAAGIKVEWALGEYVGDALVDRIQIQQVLTNLIRNAIDAMQDSDSKNLTISTARSGDMIKISVADSGAGIPENLRPRIFERFVSVKKNGMGVGLSISKSIIDAHQGEIVAKNKESGGCVFSFKLPTGGQDGAEG